MTPWSAQLRTYLETGWDESWASPTQGPARSAARRALRRATRPVTQRQAEANRLIDRALHDSGFAVRATALAIDPPLAAHTSEVESDVGPLLIHAHDQVISPQLRETGTWEPSEGAWLRSVIHPGDTVVDCGANVGYFSLLAARATGSSGNVLAVEPEAGNLRLLRANLWRNAADHVSVVPVAASDARGTVALRRNATNTGDHQSHAEAQPDDVLVPCLALDELLEGMAVDVIKIDTQGVDHLVVAGLRATLAANPGASLLVEFWLDGMTARSIAPSDVLRDYRALGRPIALLTEDAEVRDASDDEVLTTAAESPGRWVNLVIGPA